MGGSDRRKYDSYGYKASGGKELEDGKIDIDALWKLKPFLVCLCACDEHGKLLFDAADLDFVEETLPSQVIVDLSDAAIAFNKLSIQEEKEEQKNSVSGTTNDS